MAQLDKALSYVQVRTLSLPSSGSALTNRLVSDAHSICFLEVAGDKSHLLLVMVSLEQSWQRSVQASDSRFRWRTLAVILLIFCLHFLSLNLSLQTSLGLTEATSQSRSKGKHQRVLEVPMSLRGPYVIPASGAFTDSKWPASWKEATQKNEFKWKTFKHQLDTNSSFKKHLILLISIRHHLSDKAVFCRVLVTPETGTEPKGKLSGHLCRNQPRIQMEKSWEDSCLALLPLSW